MRVQRFAFLALALFVVLVAGGPEYAVYLQTRVITHIVLTALLIAWLGWRISKRHYLPATPLNAPLYAGALVLALSAAFGLDPRMGVEHAWWPLVHGLLFFVCAGMIQGGRQRWLFEALFLIGAVTVIAAGAEFVNWAGPALASVDLGAVLRGAAGLPPAPMLSKPLHASTALAGFVTPQIVIAFAWAATARRGTDRIALAGLGVALGLVLLGTGSRGGVLALGAAAVTFLLLRLAPSLQALRRGEKRSRGRVLLGVGAAVLIAVTAAGVVLEVSQEAGHSSGDVVRASLWNSAAVAAQEHPVLGIGPGQFGRAVRLYRPPDAPADFVHRQAHNIVLNTAAEEGIAGLLVLGWMTVMVGVGWIRNRRTATGGRALRLDAVLAALIAVAVQSQFDVFFTTPFVGLVALLAAYAVVPPGLVAPVRVCFPEKAASWAALVLVIGYGLFWIPVDRAQADFERSVRDQDIASAQQAAALDPGLHLYDLQIAYLTGLRSTDDPALRPDAIAQYERALALEPTWDTGWINLAGLYEQAGRIPDALAALAQAQAINPLSAAGWNRARLAGSSTPAQMPESGAWVDRNFEGVLFGRTANFQLLPGMSPSESRPAQ